MNVDDDDSDNDSDYVPGDDEEKDVEQKETVLLNIASNKRKRKASALWDEICVEDHEYVTSKLSKSAFRYTDQLFEEPPRRVRAKIRRYFKQLAGRRADGPEDSPDEDKTANKDEMHADLRKELVEAFQRVKRKTVVTESRKFAGQEIQYVPNPNPAPCLAHCIDHELCLQGAEGGECVQGGGAASGPGGGHAAGQGAAADEGP